MIKIGDLVTLRSGLNGVVVNIELTKWDTSQNKPPKPSVIEVLTEESQIARVLPSHLDFRR